MNSKHWSIDLHYYWEPILHNGQKEGFVLLSTKMTEIKKGLSTNMVDFNH